MHWDNRYVTLDWPNHCNNQWLLFFSMSSHPIIEIFNNSNNQLVNHLCCVYIYIYMFHWYCHAIDCEGLFLILSMIIRTVFVVTAQYHAQFWFYISSVLLWYHSCIMAGVIFVTPYYYQNNHWHHCLLYHIPCDIAYESIPYKSSQYVIS